MRFEDLYLVGETDLSTSHQVTYAVRAEWTCPKSMGHALTSVNLTPHKAALTHTCLGVVLITLACFTTSFSSARARFPGLQPTVYRCKVVRGLERNMGMNIMKR